MLSNKSLGLPAPIVGWIHNHAVKNYWRVAGWYEIDDLIQDGLLKAYQCRERYGLPGGPECPSCGGLDHRLRLVKRGSFEIALNTCRGCGTGFIAKPHFMALVKTAFHRHITELLRTKRGVDDLTVKTADNAPDLDDNTALVRLGTSDPLQEFALLVAELPERLRRVVQFYLNEDPTRLWRNLRVRLDGKDETLSERLYKLTGFPEDQDFETELRSYLWEREAELI